MTHDDTCGIVICQAFVFAVLLCPALSRHGAVSS
jgi:hypothetical protein